jgi:hypothetical protein
MGATTPEAEDAERDALNQIASQFKDDSRSGRWSLAGWTKAAMPIGRPVSHVPVGEARCATVPLRRLPAVSSRIATSRGTASTSEQASGTRPEEDDGGGGRLAPQADPRQFRDDSCRLPHT